MMALRVPTPRGSARLAVSPTSMDVASVKLDARRPYASRVLGYLALPFELSFVAGQPAPAQMLRCKT